MTARARLAAVSFALAVASLHCGGSTPTPPTPSSSSTMTTDSSTTTPCTLSLLALATGDYGGWHGLTDACTTADAVAAFGAPEGGDRSGFPGGSPTRYRIYPASAGAPQGLHVYDVDDRIVLITTHDARPAGPLVDLLGAPDAEDPSRMPGFKTMWIWASRGLTLHLDDDTGAVAWLYAYAPMTLDAFRASWLAQVEIHRTRVQ